VLNLLPHQSYPCGRDSSDTRLFASGQMGPYPRHLLPLLLPARMLLPYSDFRSSIANDSIRTDDIPFTNLCVTLDVGVWQDGRIFADLYSGFDISRGGIRHADAVQHVFAIDTYPHGGLCFA